MTRTGLTAGPSGCALVIVECQNGVVGRDALLPELADTARPVLTTIGRLARVARAAGVQVVHATYQSAAGGRAAGNDTPLFRTISARTAGWRAGSAPVQVVPEIGVAPQDLVMPRHHGLSPTQGTELLPVLRNLGVGTLVVAGVSLNIAIPSVVVDAVNEGFRVIVPRDAVSGTPPEYAEAVLRHTVAMVATLSTAADLAAAWTRGSVTGGEGDGDGGGESPGAPERGGASPA